MHKCIIANISTGLIIVLACLFIHELTPGTTFAAPTEDEIKSDLTVLDQLDKLEDHFKEMVTMIKKKYTNAQLQGIKNCLAAIFPSDLQSCRSYDLLFQVLLTRHLHPFNIYALEVISENFPNDGVKHLTDGYTTARNEFCSACTVHSFERANCCRDFPICPKGMKQFALKLPTNATEQKTMREIEKLVRGLLGEHARHLAACYAKQGCITISWFFPESLTIQLQESAGKNTQLLEAEMVEELTIAGIVVFPIKDKV